MTRTNTWLLLLAAGIAFNGIAHAQTWGPIGRTAIVTTGAHLVSRDLTMPLTQFDQYVREGAALTEEEIFGLYPDAQIDLVRAIEKEIYLLQAIRGDRIDPYFAFRLGALGQLAASAVAPMSTGSPEYRQAYFQDAERHIQRVPMTPGPRRVIDATYFPERTRRAVSQDDTIESDYQSGIGFEGFALAALPEDASRAVNAVADVIYTVVIAPVSRLNISQTDQRNYALDALQYYLEKDKVLEADAAVNAVLDSGAITPEMEKQIADVYFEAEHYAKAMEHYESVLRADPTQREVAQRISEYHEGRGDTASSAKFLEDARDAYARSASADPLNEEAHRKLYTAEREIEARDARLEAAKAALEGARELEGQAEQAKRAQNYVESLARFREAKALYESVTDEFPELARDASRGVRLIDLATKELQTNLVGSVQQLSGSGYPFTARRLGRATPGVEKATFQALQQIELNTAMDTTADEIAHEIEALR